jgi:hypothetical protein
LAAGAVAEGDGDGAFGVLLADYVFVEFDHDLAGSEFVECELFFFGAAGEIDGHKEFSISVLSSQWRGNVLADI